MKTLSTKKLTLAGLFLALGLILPFLTGQIQSIGSSLLPMHIPVLLCGFICGGPYGLVVGFVLPVLRSMLFGMPPMYPIALAMSFELAAYGALSGYLYRLLPKKDFSVYATLLVSMFGGRIVWGIASLILFGLSGSVFNLKIFLAGSFFKAIPGIILQIVLIPILIIALKRANLLEKA